MRGAVAAGLIYGLILTTGLSFDVGPESETPAKSLYESVTDDVKARLHGELSRLAPELEIMDLQLAADDRGPVWRIIVSPSRVRATSRAMEDAVFEQLLWLSEPGRALDGARYTVELVPAERQPQRPRRA